MLLFHIKIKRTIHCTFCHSVVPKTMFLILDWLYLIFQFRSVACYDNALTLKPRWSAAERNRYAVLCHHKLEVSLYQLHRYS